MRTACPECTKAFTHTDGKPYGNRNFGNVVFTCPKCGYKFSAREAHTAFKKRLKLNPSSEIAGLVRDLWPGIVFLVVAPILFFVFVW